MRLGLPDLPGESSDEEEEQPSEEGAENVTAVPEAVGAKYCEICHMMLNGPTQYDDHKIGKKHKKNINKGGANNTIGRLQQPPPLPPPRQPKTKLQQPPPPMLLGRQFERPPPDASSKEGGDPPAKTASPEDSVTMDYPYPPYPTMPYAPFPPYGYGFYGYGYSMQPLWPEAGIYLQSMAPSPPPYEGQFLI